MYGTAEAKDFETGEAYTEYIMRCQWGRTFETMRPWMVARRFREFVAVDANLRRPDTVFHSDSSFLGILHKSQWWSLGVRVRYRESRRKRGPLKR